MNFLTFAKRIFLAAIFSVGFIGWADGAGLPVGGPNNNIFSASPLLPATLKRVVVLPLAHEDSQADLAGGCEMLFPVLQSELIKAKKFEVVAASSKTVQNLTGKSNWTGAEALSPDFFSSLQQTYAADAVLFCEVTTFHAYPPLVMGWRMKLVDVSTQKIIWAADVVFDASDPAVNKGAREFQKQQQAIHDKPQTFFSYLWARLGREPEPITDDQWTVLNSPRYFGQFTVSALLQTLPQR